MEDLQKVAHQLEYLFLKRVASGLRDGSIDIPTAKQLARSFLAIEPFTSIDDAKQKMQQFTQQHNYFAVLKEYVDAYYSEQQKNEVIEQMRTHLREGNIDKALQVVK